MVLVAVSSLSKQARNAWKEREKLKSFTVGVPEGQEAAEQKPDVPWYVNMDIDWYIENYKERYYKAVELGNVVRKFLQYDEGDRTKYAEEFAQKHLGKGQRTLYRYTKAYLEASAWADKLQKEDGAGYESSRFSACAGNRRRPDASQASSRRSSRSSRTYGSMRTLPGTKAPVRCSMRS